MTSANLKLVLGSVLLLLGGLAIPAGIMIPALDAPAEEIVFEVPGQASLEVEAAGRFYLWHNYRTIHQGRQVVHDKHLPDGMSFELTRLDDGSTLALQPRSNINTEMADAASSSVAYVDIEQPGRFRIEVGGGDDRTRVMSFSRSRFMLFARAIGFSLLSIAVLGTAGIVLIVLGIVQRTGREKSS